MGWYYLDNGQEAGPFTKEEMNALVKSGAIVRDTQVRSDKSPNWTTYGQLLDSAKNKRSHQTQRVSPAQSVQHTRAQICTECGGSFAGDELLTYQDAKVCASCKPVFFQRLKEGVADKAIMRYAGFWIRFCAKFLDWIILGIANSILNIAWGLFLAPPVGVNFNPEEMFTPAFFFRIILLNILQLTVAATYTTFFLGKYAATPGKMALGLKVVRSDGDKISYLRAFGRHFAEILSAIILLIGYIMAAFDKQKRALHDHICDTRVIRK